MNKYFAESEFVRISQAVQTKFFDIVDNQKGTITGSDKVNNLPLWFRVDTSQSGNNINKLGAFLKTDALSWYDLHSFFFISK